MKSMPTLTVVSPHSITGLLSVFLSCLFLLAPIQGQAMQGLDDSGLSEVTGTGLAIALTNYQTGWGATSYLEAVGTDVTDTTLKSYGFTRADAYWYGGTYSGANSVRAWAGTCGAGIGNLGCPIGGLIAKFAPYDNPLLLRVFNYTQSPSGAQLLDYAGNQVTSLNPRTIFEVLGPTKQDPFKFSFWAEERVVGTPTAPGSTGTLQSQVIMGNSTLTSPVNGVAGNSKVRLLQASRATDQTFGLIWENHYQGDFRFSVNQQAASPGVAGLAPMFSDYEGMYARNIKTYVPLGQLFYQTLTFDDPIAGKNGASLPAAAVRGNFVIDLTSIPNTTAVYNDFYGYTGAYTDGGAFTAQTKSARYNETHGYFSIGSITSGVFNNCSGSTPTASSACIKDTNDGVFFSAWHPSNASAQFKAFANRPDVSQYHTYGGNGDGPLALPYACGNYNTGGGCGTATNADIGAGGSGGGVAPAGSGFMVNSVNLGDVEIKGMLIQHLKITTLGAGS
ncbi:MAG: hypothetical protein REI12_10405 [Pedobacter sp.]|nr:hypothetical protein [Pedobacter sp.]